MSNVVQLYLAHRVEFRICPECRKLEAQVIVQQAIDRICTCCRKTTLGDYQPYPAIMRTRKERLADNITLNRYIRESDEPDPLTMRLTN